MALSQKHRHSIFERLSPTLGEEETEALLSQFPSSERDEPVTTRPPRCARPPVSGPISPSSRPRSLAPGGRSGRADAPAGPLDLRRVMVSGMGIAAAISQAIG